MSELASLREFEDTDVIERHQTPPRRHYDPLVVWLSLINTACFVAVVLVILLA